MVAPLESALSFPVFVFIAIPPASALSLSSFILLLRHRHSQSNREDELPVYFHSSRKLHGKTTALGSTVQQANGIVTVAPKPSSSTDDVRETKHVGFSRRASGERRTNSARTS